MVDRKCYPESTCEEQVDLLSVCLLQVAFTGSGPVGRLVAQAASKNIKPVTLELGGKSPAIVWKDVDITEATPSGHSSHVFLEFLFWVQRLEIHSPPNLTVVTIRCDPILWRPHLRSAFIFSFRRQSGSERQRNKAKA